MDSNSIKKILVIIVSRIGDSMLTMPAIRSIAHFYKDAEITILAHPKRHSIFKNLPFVDKLDVITKNTALYRSRFGKKKYDLAFVYGYDKSLIQYALRSSRKVVAFKQKDDKINNMLYKAVDFPNSEIVHFVDIFLALPRSIGIHEDSKRLSIALTSDEIIFAEKTLNSKKLNNKLLIGIQAVSFPTKDFRDWPIKCFLDLCQQISHEDPNVHFLIYGGPSPEEKIKLDMLFNGLRKNATNFIGMSLRETAALMSKTNLYIGVDTGPTHIMSTFNIPMIVLFHCKLKSKIYGALEHPYYFPIDHPNSDNCSEKSPMSDILVKTVLKEVNKALIA
jgi:heptosyltransferase III